MSSPDAAELERLGIPLAATEDFSISPGELAESVMLRHLELQAQHAEDGVHQAAHRIAIKRRRLGWKTAPLFVTERLAQALEPLDDLVHHIDCTCVHCLPEQVEQRHEVTEGYSDHQPVFDPDPAGHGGRVLRGWESGTVRIDDLLHERPDGGIEIRPPF